MGAHSGRIDLYAKENLPAVHPVEHQPIRDEREGAEEERLECRAEGIEYARAQIDEEAALDEVLAEMGHEIGGDGVRSDDNEREGDPAPAAHIDDPREGGEEQKADSAGEERPGGGPDAFYDGADAGEVKEKPEGDERCRRNEKSAKRKARG